MDYSNRWYDNVVGRFVSVDKLADKYPFNGVYNFAEDKPINGVDLDGLEWVHFQVAKNIIDVKIQTRVDEVKSLSQEQLKLYFDAISTEYKYVLESSSNLTFR